MICPFDLFGKDRYIYTFEGICLEDENIKINDGATRIFINTHGKNRDEVSPEFLALIDFIEYNETKNASENANLEKIVSKVEAIKSSEVIGVKYMQNWEEKLEKIN